MENNEVQRNEKDYRLHRQSDLLECALRAIRWAVTRAELEGDTPLILMGHSEGAQIMVGLYLALLKEDNDIASRISLIQLSGTPLIPWKQMINDQIQSEEERTRFWKALENGDEDYFMDISAKVPMGYLQEVIERNALDIELKEMAQLGVDTRFEFHHGSQDCQISVQYLEKFVCWNNEQKAQQKPHLNLHTFVYEANHDLTEAKESAMNNMFHSISEAIR